jgi:hypothetical protein
MANKRDKKAPVNTLIFNFVKELIPIHPISQLASMFEQVLAFLLVAILITLILTVRGRRNAEELEQVVKMFEFEGAKMESFIRDEYRLASVEDAVKELESLKSGLTKIFSFFSRNL